VPTVDSDAVNGKGSWHLPFFKQQGAQAAFPNVSFENSIIVLSSGQSCKRAKIIRGKSGDDKLEEDILKFSSLSLHFDIPAAACYKPWLVQYHIQLHITKQISVKLHQKAKRTITQEER